MPIQIIYMVTQSLQLSDVYEVLLETLIGKPNFRTLNLCTPQLECEPVLLHLCTIFLLFSGYKIWKGNWINVGKSTTKKVYFSQIPGKIIFKWICLACHLLWFKVTEIGSEKNESEEMTSNNRKWMASYYIQIITYSDLSDWVADFLQDRVAR